MEVEFKDKRLAQAEVGSPSELAALKLPFEVIGRIRDRLAFLRAAPDERTIRNWRSLHYEKLKGDRDGQRSIRINDQWRLIFLLDSERNPPKIVILGVEDYH